MKTIPKSKEYKYQLKNIFTGQFEVGTAQLDEYSAKELNLGYATNNSPFRLIKLN